MDKTSQTDSPTLLQVDSTPLELDDDYFDVLSELTPLAASWKSIGFALRLKHDALEKIDKQHSGNPSACLGSMVTEWLRKNYNVKKFGEPNWQRLAKAVGDAAGGANKALSKRIAKKHTPRLSALPEAKQTPSSPPGSAETQAQGTIMSSSPTPSAMSDHLSPLQPPVQPAVVPRATSSSPHNYPQADQSPPPNPITIFNYPSTPPPSLQLSKSAVFALENRQAIIAKFATFQTKVCNKLLMKGVDTEQVSLFFTNEFPPGDCIPQPPASLPEIFKAITYHRLWDFIHYSPLVHIVQTFGANDPEMESWVQTYRKDLKAYSIITTVEDFIEADLDVTDLEIDDLPPAKRAKRDPRYCCPVVWKTSFLDHTLQHLTEVWEMFSNRYLMPDSPPTALLDRVCKGCFVITWLIPSSLVSSLVERAKSDTDFFQQHRIQRVTVGGECVYEQATEECAENFQFKNVEDAAGRIRKWIKKTPLEISRRLSEMLQMNIYLKKDYLLPTGSSKERGARNTLELLSLEQKTRGVITASAGNHGLALAYHGKQLNVPVTVVLPENSPKVKVHRCKECGAKTILHGRDIGESKKFATEKAKKEQLQYVNGYNDLTILAGQGVVALEVFEQMDELGVEPDAIVIPVGGGGLLAGMTTVIQHSKPHMEIIAVESEMCPSFNEAIRAGKPVEAMSDSSTIADGLLVPTIGENSFKIVRTYTNNFERLRLEVVKEKHIEQGMMKLEKEEGIEVEGAGAIGLAACLYNPKLQNHLREKNVVLMLTGRNVD